MAHKPRYFSGHFSITLDQVTELINSFDNIHDKALIEFAIITGIRRADIVKIKRKDFIPETGALTFFESKKKITRTIYLPSTKVIQSLTMHLNTSRSSEWLFPSPKKTGKFKNAHISDRHIYDIFNEALDSIGISRRPFHSLRATCYKLCQERGWSGRKACELIGDSLEVAEQHYNAPSTEEMKAIAKEKELI